MKSAEMLAAEYPITMMPIPAADGGGYYAYCDKFPGLLGDGATMDQAAADYRAVLVSVIEDRLASGTVLPSIDDPLIRIAR